MADEDRERSPLHELGERPNLWDNLVETRDKFRPRRGVKYGAGGSGLGPLVCLVYLYTDNDSLAAKRYRDSLMSWQVPDTEKLSLTPLLHLCSPGGILQTYCQYLILRLAPTPAQSRIKQTKIFSDLKNGWCNHERLYSRILQ